MKKKWSKKWRVPFAVRKLGSNDVYGRSRSKPWCVYERFESSVGLVSFWFTRDEAREAARQLNQEERRYA